MRSLLPMFDDGFFGNGMLDSFFDDFSPAAAVKVPKVDIEELKDHYEIKADLPGFTKDEVSITYTNDVLTIEAKKDDTKETKDEDRHFLRRERVATAFRRQFAVKGIKKEDIKADLKDGILTICLPKVEQEVEKAPYHIQIG